MKKTLKIIGIVVGGLVALTLVVAAVGTWLLNIHVGVDDEAISVCIMPGWKYAGRDNTAPIKFRTNVIGTLEYFADEQMLRVYDTDHALLDEDLLLEESESGYDFQSYTITINEQWVVHVETTTCNHGLYYDQIAMTLEEWEIYKSNSCEEPVEP